jgi:lysophospholipase L1-like esterase
VNGVQRRNPRADARSKLARRASLALALFFAVDLAGGYVLRTGRASWRALPPFDATTNDPQRAWLAQELDRPRAGAATFELVGSTVEFDPQLGWCNAPGSSSADGRARYGATGARGVREYARARANGAALWTTFGDSFTHGDGLANDETWQHLIESRRAHLQVANFGVGGYGVDQALMRYRRDGRPLASDVVWIGLMLEDVGRHVNRYRPLYHPNSPTCAAKPRFIVDNGSAAETQAPGALPLASAAAALRPIAIPYDTREQLIAAIASGAILGQLADHEGWPNRWPSWSRHSAVLTLAAGWQFYRSVDAQRLWTTPSEARLVSLALLRRFHDEARADGARAAVVLVYPRRQELAHVRAGGARWWSEPLGELAREGVPVLDLCDALDAAGDELDALYQPDGHPSRRAAMLIADAVLAYADARL